MKKAAIKSLEIFVTYIDDIKQIQICCGGWDGRLSREGELLERSDGDTANHGKESGVHGQGEDLSEEQGAEERREERLSRLVTQGRRKKKEGREEGSQEGSETRYVRKEGGKEGRKHLHVGKREKKRE